MLKSKVQAWNTLRKQDPGYVPNLRAMDLDGPDLSGANLSEGDLRGAHRSARMTDADLSGTHRLGAQLEEATSQTR